MIPPIKRCMRLLDQRQYIDAKFGLANGVIPIRCEMVCRSMDANFIHVIGYDNSEVIKLRKKLSIIAYKHAHDIRGPLARILGLIDLFIHDSGNENLLAHLKKVSTELDRILQTISIDSKLEDK